MNKIYRTVYSAATGTWVVASELAKGRTKSSKTAAAIAVAAALALPGGIAHAGTDEDEDAVEQEIAVMNMAPATTEMGTNAALDDMYFKVNNSGTGVAASATGANAVAIGQFTVASGSSSVAVGSGTTATGQGSVAIGRSSANGVNAGGVGYNQQIAIGDTARTSATSATAIGYGANATAANSMALGTNSVADTADTISVGNATTQRRIVNVAAGTANTDAVNLGQMNTALSTKVDNTYIQVKTGDKGGAAASGIAAAAMGSGAAATGDYSIALGYGATATGDRSTALGAGAVVDAKAQFGMALGRMSQVTATGANSVALGQASVADRANTVSVGSATQQRQITNLAAGTANTDAVNVSQLSPVVNALGGGATINADGSVTGPTYTLANGGTQTTVGGAMGALDGALTTANTNIAKNTGDISTIRSDLSSGTVGLVQQAGAGANLTVGAGTDGAAVDFTGTAGTRKLTGVSAGNLSTTSTDAVNGAQLNATNTQVTQNTTDIGSLNTNVTNLDTTVTSLGGRMTTAEGNITDLQAAVGSGTVGLGQQAGTGADLTVGKDTNGAAVNFAGTAGERKLTGVADGTANNDAVNLGQLNTVAANINTRVDGINTRVTNNETAITDIRNEMGDGSIGLVRQDATSGAINVAADTGGTSVSFAGTAGDRKLTGVADGTANNDAANVGQLNTVAGSVTTLSTRVDGIDTSVTNLGGRMSTAEGNITNLQAAVGSGAIGLVQQDAATGNISVAAASGGSVVNFAGTGGARTLTGVANGVNDSDAVTLAQLKASGLVDKDGKELGALVYDDMSLKSATLGGTGGTFLNNVAGGLIAAGSMQAVNGGQLFAMQQKYDQQFSDLSGRFDDLDGRVGVIEEGVADGSIGGPGDGGVEEGKGGAGSIVVGDGADASGEKSSAIGQGAVASGDNSSAVGQGAEASGSNSSAVGQGAVASGENSSAIGQGAVASGDNSTALGQGAQASHDNSVALGAGSQTSRDDEVSIGAPGAERYLGNVKDGVLDTDAVNVRQLNNAIGGLQNQVDTNRRDAMGGTAAAMAVAGLPQSSMPGRTFMAIAGSTYGGEQGTALGVSYMSKDGRWIVKSAVNTSTRGEVGAVVGGGFYW